MQKIILNMIIFIVALSIFTVPTYLLISLVLLEMNIFHWHFLGRVVLGFHIAYALERIISYLLKRNAENFKP